MSYYIINDIESAREMKKTAFIMNQRTHFKSNDMDFCKMLCLCSAIKTKYLRAFTTWNIVYNELKCSTKQIIHASLKRKWLSLFYFILQLKKKKTACLYIFRYLCGTCWHISLDFPSRNQSITNYLQLACITHQPDMIDECINIILCHYMSFLIVRVLLIDLFSHYGSSHYGQ